jgi:IS6 family transposase
MLIDAHNPFKGRQHPGELIILCVRLYLRYPLSYEHVAELVAERGMEVTPVAFGVGCRPMHPS